MGGNRQSEPGHVWHCTADPIMGCAASQTEPGMVFPPPHLPSVPHSMTLRRLRVLLLSACSAWAALAANAAPQAPIKIGLGAPISAAMRISAPNCAMASRWPSTTSMLRAGSSATGSALKSATMPAIRNRARPSPTIRRRPCRLCCRPLQFRRDADGLVHLCGQWHSRDHAVIGQSADHRARA